MDSSYDRPEYNTYGVQIFTAPSAHLNLSGFEEYSAMSDPALYEAASFSGHSYNPVFTTPNVGPLSGYSPGPQHNLNLSSGSLRSSHGTYLHLLSAGVVKSFLRLSFLKSLSRDSRPPSVLLVCLIFKRAWFHLLLSIGMGLVSKSEHFFVTSYSIL